MRSFDYRRLADCLWDGEVVSLVSQIHEYKGRQDVFVSQRPSSVARLVDIAKVQSVESSNRIEGIVTTKARIRSLVADKTTPRNRDEEEIMGYRDVLNTVHENYEHIMLTSHIVLQLHRDLYAYSYKGIGGQFKNVQNSIIERLVDGSEVERFKPLAPYETPDAIDEICHSVNAVLQDKSVDPLLAIPVFIHDFLCVHPFNDGNGRMSRLLTTLLLYQNGYMIGKFISLEQKIERTKDSYYAALAQSGVGWHTGDEDVVPFVKYMLQIILAAYRDFESRIALLKTSLSAKEWASTAAGIPPT